MNLLLKDGFRKMEEYIKDTIMIRELRGLEVLLGGCYEV